MHSQACSEILTSGISCWGKCFLDPKVWHTRKLKFRESQVHPPIMDPMGRDYHVFTKQYPSSVLNSALCG